MGRLGRPATGGVAHLPDETSSPWDGRMALVHWSTLARILACPHRPVSVIPSPTGAVPSHESLLSHPDAGTGPTVQALSGNWNANRAGAGQGSASRKFSSSNRNIHTDPASDYAAIAPLHDPAGRSLAMLAVLRCQCDDDRLVFFVFDFHGGGHDMATREQNCQCLGRCAPCSCAADRSPCFARLSINQRQSQRCLDLGACERKQTWASH